MWRGSLSHLCEDRLCRRCPWELRKTFTDVFHHVLDLYNKQLYPLIYHSGRSVVSEKRSSDLLFWAVSWMSLLHHSSNTMLEIPHMVPASQVPCQWHLCPCSPSFSLKRLFSIPARTCKHILLNAVGGGGSSFTVGKSIGNSKRVPFCCLGERWLLKVGWSVSKAEWEDGEYRPTSFTSLFGEEGKSTVSNYFRQVFLGKWQSILVCRKQLLPL